MSGNTNGVPCEEQGPTKKARTRLAGIANEVGHAASNAHQRFAKKASQSRHRLHESAQKVGHAARELATEVLHSAQEAAQKVIDHAKEVATTAEHRESELTGKPDRARKGP